VTGIAVRAVDQGLRKERPLGPHAPAFRAETRTDHAGHYEIPYTAAQLAEAEDDSANLMVRALDAARAIVAASPILFKAPRDARVDLVLSGAVAGQPSEYERLTARLSPLLADLDPPEVSQLTSSDLSFLIGKTGVSETILRALVNAASLYRDAAGRGAHVPVAAFYALARQDLQASWTRLAGAPVAALTAAITRAVADGTAPAGLQDRASSIAAGIADVAASQALGTADGRSSALGKLLAAAGLAAEQQRSLLTATAAHIGSAPEFWAQLATRPGFTNPAVIARLQLTGQLTLITGSHLPLIKAVLADPAITTAEDLVGLDADAWNALLSHPVDGEPAGPPPGAPAAAYVQQIIGIVHAAFPGQSLSRMINADSSLISDIEVRDTVTQVLAGDHAFDIRTTRITDYARSRPAALASLTDQARAAAVTQLQRLQRAFQISVSPGTMTTLLALGLDAAHRIADLPRQAFLATYAEQLGGEANASSIYDRATFINTRNLMLITQLNDIVNGLYPAALIGRQADSRSDVARDELIRQYPDFAGLFGAFDPCTCQDCTSVLSPAAYLVDLLEFLKASPDAAGQTPRDVLLSRRPDLAYLPLTCENTYTELPYLDLVNEVLEAYVLFSDTPTRWAAHDTADLTTPQLDAGPQFTLDASAYDLSQGAPQVTLAAAGAQQASGPYFTLSQACFPFSLPFNQPLTVARTYLSFMGTSRQAILAAAQPALGAASPALDAECLGMDPYLYQLLTARDLAGNAAPAPSVAARYGYANQPPSFERWLASVPVFLQQTGVSLADLTQLLATRYVNPGYPAGPDRTLFTALPLGYADLAQLASAGFAAPTQNVSDALASAGITVAELAAWWARNPGIGQIIVIDTPNGCDVADARLAHLSDQSAPTDAELTRLHVFIRLWRSLGWAISDVDRALTALAAPAITDVIAGLARIKQLSAELSPASLQVLLAMWSQISTDGEDALYGQLFLNPGLTPLDAAFTPVNGSVLPGAAVISDHIPALLRALQVSAGDLALIRTDAGLTDPPAPAPAPALTLDNVSTMYRYAALAQLLRMSVSDLVALKTLAAAAGSPFATPEATARFVRLAKRVQASQFSVGELTYLYAGTSDPVSGLAPQQTTLVTLAAALRTGLTQIIARTTPAADPQGTLSHDVIAQLISAAAADQIVSMIGGTAVYSAPLTTPLPAGIALTGPGGNVAGLNPQLLPASVGSKLSYDPASSTLRYTGAMTDTERQALTAQFTPLADAGAILTAVNSLYQLPSVILPDTLGGLLTDPAATDKLLHLTPSLDGQLNPVPVNASGAQIPPGPGPAVSTAAAWKFAYLLNQLLPALRIRLSHALVKQAVADAFSFDTALASTLLEQVLSSPSAVGQPLVSDLLGLADTGVTVRFYATADASGAAIATTTMPTAAVDGTTAAVPAGTASATFSSWLTVPNSATFTFTVETNGTPRLQVGDLNSPLPLTEDPATQTWTGTASLAAGATIWLGLTVTALPAAPEPFTALLRWAAPTVPKATVPAAAQLPSARMDSFTSAYTRLQKAVILATGFAITAEEIGYLQAAGSGAQSLFGGFDLNKLPLAPDPSAAQASARFASWPRLDAFTALRHGLPVRPVTLIDVFEAGMLGQAQGLLAQATGWDAAAISDMLAQFLPAGMTPASPNPITDETIPARMQAIMSLAQATGASAAQLLAWTATATSARDGYDALHAIAQDIKNTTASHNDPVTWLTVAQPLSDKIRAAQRDALVSYAMARNGFTDTGQLFELLLIDTEMGACMATSRIRQAINSVQLFVQRCLLNLEEQVSPNRIDASEWNTWRGQYSLWAAAREVFLFPERYLIPRLRDDQTPAFTEFAGSLLQNDITSDTAEQAFLAYLEDLDDVARLDIRGVFWQDTDLDTGEPVDILHVVGRTWHSPRKYYYRRLLDGKTWTPWTPVTTDITGDHLIPVIWERRLRLVWPVFTIQTYQQPVTPVTAYPKSGDSTPVTGQPPQNYWQITLAWSEYSQGKWQPKHVTEDFLVSWVQPRGRTGDQQVIQPDPSLHMFKGRIEGDDLVIDCYVQAFPSPITTGKGESMPLATLLGQFRFSACGDSVSVSYADQEDFDWAWPASITPSPHTAQRFSSRSFQYFQPQTDPYYNGMQQDSAAPAKFVGSWGLDWTSPLDFWNAFQHVTETEYLGLTPSQYELRYPQQDWQFALQWPFFYQDEQRTFYVVPVQGDPLISRVAKANEVNPGLITATGDAAQIRGQIVAADAATRDGPAAPDALSAQGPVSAGMLAWPAFRADDVNWMTPVRQRPDLTGSTLLSFQTHRHPYVCSLIKQLIRERDSAGTAGVDGLLTIGNQELTSDSVFPPFDFAAEYLPDPQWVEHQYPVENIDFSLTGPYSVYNWELFFHAPLLVALTLSQNQRFADADRWFRYIFDPTSADALTLGSPGYWQVEPMRTQVTQTLLDLMAAIDNNDPDALEQVKAWTRDPFKPFAIARGRRTAFMKSVFTAYVGNLIAWGDQLYGQVDTIESINQATQLYVLAGRLLGDAPEQVPPPHKQPSLCYAQLEGKIDQFGNVMELMENEFPYAGGVPALNTGAGGALCGFSKTLLFCIPQDTTLLQYWNTVQNRLGNIRQCKNLQGAPQKLALFAPWANPLLLIEAAAEGTDPGSVLSDLGAPIPNYRFAYLLSKASDYAAECRVFGRMLLDALEKNDAEGLAVLRATQETAILTMMRDIKQARITEAQAGIDALSVSRQVAAGRYGYYQSLLGASGPAVPEVGANIPPVTIPNQPAQPVGGAQLSAQEQSELNLAQQAAGQHAAAQAIEQLASIAAMAPSLSINLAAEPMGVGEVSGISFGGSNFAAAAEAVAKGFELQAGVLAYQAATAGKMAIYLRRQQEWALQSNLASGEIMRIDQDLLAAQTRFTIAQDELKTHDQQTANAQQAHDFLTGKYTSQELYGWMITQASGLYSQLYQLAYSTAKLAERAYQRELAVPDSSYITFGYWDSLRKGLLAGERLQAGLKQLERAYLDQNQREYEITRHLSLLLHDPRALIALKVTGECVVEFPEALFDLDYPGHYLRRLRDVSLTIPCVAGPYTPVNCTLTLLSSKIRFDPGTAPSGGGASGYAEQPGSKDPRFLYYFAATQSIATSHAQNDSGVFELSFRDERYLPFETAGAISRWLIRLPAACNAFDVNTITDVVVKLSYTARDGGDMLRTQALQVAKLPAPPNQTAPASLTAPGQDDRTRLFSLRHEFPAEWYAMLHPASAAAQFGQLLAKLSQDRFPYQYRGDQIKTDDIELFAILGPANGSAPPLATVNAYLTAQAPPLDGHPPVPPAPSATDLVALNPQPALFGPGAPVLYGRLKRQQTTAVPYNWWLSAPAAELADIAQRVSDIYAVFHYTVTLG